MAAASSSATHGLIAVLGGGGDEEEPVGGPASAGASSSSSSAGGTGMGTGSAEDRDNKEGQGQGMHQLEMVVSDRCHTARIALSLPCDLRPAEVAFDASYWTLAEDRVLLLYEMRQHKQREQEFVERRKKDKKLTLEDVPLEMDGAQLLKDYRREAARNPKLFTHRRASGKMLLRRLEELPATGTRYQLLLDDVTKQMELDSTSSGDGLGEGSSSMGVRSRSMSPSRKRNLYNPKLTVVLRSEGTTYDPVVVDRRSLVRVSERIKHDVMEQLVIDDEDLLDTNPVDVSVSYDDKSDELALYNTFGLFHPKYFQKLVEFAKEPNAMQDERELREKVDRLYKKQQDTIDELILEMDTRKKEFFEKLQEEQDRQVSEIRESFMSSFERDMKQLKRMYDFHLENELAKLEFSYRDIKRTKAEYWDSEVSVARNLVERTGNIETAHLVRQLDRLQATCEHVYDAQTLPNLLLLSDFMQVDQLRSCCVELISKEWRKFRSRKELGCRILRDNTLGELTSKFSLDELLRLETSVDHSLRADVLAKEIEFRKLLLSEDYRTLTNDELAALYEDPSTKFPDLLQRELARRQQAKQKITLLSATASTHLAFSGDKLQMSTVKGRKYMTAQAVLGKSSRDWGKVYCEFTIEELGRAPGCTMCFGWDRQTTREENTQGLLPGRLAGELSPMRGRPSSASASGSGGGSGAGRHRGREDKASSSAASAAVNPPPVSAEYACSLQTNGVFYMRGRGTFTQVMMETGDVVGMGLDLEVREPSPAKIVPAQRGATILFTKNGEIIRSIGNYGIVPLDSADFEIFPTVTLYNSKDGNRMAVSANFCGPFDFPPPASYLPYSLEKSS